MYLFELSMSILQVEARIDEESERAKHYLDPTTEEPILKVKINILCLDRMKYCLFLVPVALHLINSYVK